MSGHFFCFIMVTNYEHHFCFTTYNLVMKRDTKFEAKIFETIHALGRHWIKVLKSPSAKMLEKYPILPDILPYVYAQTHKLDDPEFEYTLLTRLAWLYNDYDDFGICENCESKIIHWNFANYKD